VPKGFLKFPQSHSPGKFLLKFSQKNWASFLRFQGKKALFKKKQKKPQRKTKHPGKFNGAFRFSPLTKNHPQGK